MASNVLIFLQSMLTEYSQLCGHETITLYNVVNPLTTEHIMTLAPALNPAALGRLLHDATLGQVKHDDIREDVSTKEQQRHPLQPTV
jgi:hypothetical protein